MNLMRGYIVSVFGVFITIIVVIVGLRFSGEAAFITGTFSALITLAITSLKFEIDDTIRKLEIIIENKKKEVIIENRLSNKAFAPIIDYLNDEQIVNKYLEFISDLTEGILPEYIAKVRRIELLPKVKKSICASAYHPTLDSLKRWDFTWLKDWEQRTCKIARINKEVLVERIYLLNQSQIIQKNKCVEEAYKIFERQSACDVKVRILWLDTTLKFSDDHTQFQELRRNFTIFDGIEVLETHDSGQLMFRNSSKTEKFKEYYKIQRMFSKPWNDAIDEVADIKVAQSARRGLTQ